MLSHTGGHGDLTAPCGFDPTNGMAELVDTVDEVRIGARRLLREGADVIKVCATGGMGSPHDQPDDEGLTIEEIQAVVDEVARHGGRPVAAHAQGTAGILNAIRGGVTRVEHGYGINDEAIDLPGAGATQTHILVNYYFTGASSLILAMLGGFIIDRVLEPRLPRSVDPAEEVSEEVSTVVRASQRRAFRIAAAVGTGYLGLLLTAWLLPSSALRGKGGTLIPSPVLSSIPVLLFVGLMITAVTYGFSARSFTRSADVPEAMGSALTPMTGYIVLMFVVAQVTAIFTWSNVGTLIAVRSASGLDALGLNGLALVILFVLLTCVLNLFIVSGSALWSLIAPVFVPTFMLLGLQPAIALAGFRIGDSATALITPMNVYLFVVLSMLRRYEPEAKFGTLIARMVTFVVPFLVAWTAILGVFYLADLPLGPGAGVHMP